MMNALQGTIKNGQVILDFPVALPEGTRVEVLPIEDSPPRSAPRDALQPRDEWERGLLAAASDCGVSLSNEAVSSEGLYE
jgi:hypothetical protein